MEATELEAKIEEAYSAWTQDPKPERAEEVRTLALQYKEVTGNFYIRNFERGCKE